MVVIGRFGIEAAGRQRAHPRFVELGTVAEVLGSRNDRGDPIVRMVMRSDLGMRRNPQQDSVEPVLWRVALKHDCLDAGDPGRSCAGAFRLAKVERARWRAYLPRVP